MSELSQSELITPEDISEIFKNVIPTIKEQATKQITDKIKSQLSWKFESIISDEVLISLLLKRLFLMFVNN